MSLLIKSAIISLVLILMGVTSIMQINNDFVSNVTITTGVSVSTIRGVNSFGTLSTFVIIPCILLLILSLQKKNPAVKARKKPKKMKRHKR